MTKTTGLDSLYQSLENMDPEMAGRERCISLIDIDAQKFITDNRPQFREMLDELSAMTERHGIVVTMMAARLFLEVQKYRLRHEPFVGEFDTAFGEAARMLAQSFVLVGC